MPICAAGAHATSRLNVILSGLLIAALVLLPGVAALAQEDLPVRIKADSFRYDRRTRVLTATGHVILTADDVEIQADALTANLESGAVRAEGHVLLRVGGQAASAEVLTYNLKTRTGTLIGARAEYAGPLVLGAVKLRAERMEGDPGRFISARNAFVTTCDEQHPCLHLTADHLSVFVNDRIVGRGVGVWVGGRRIFTLPYFLIFLRERRESRLTPVVGYSESEGWFVKTSYSYFLNEDHYGFVHADWMERLGVGIGVEHIYRLRDGQGSAFVYRLANRRTGGADLRSIINHTQDLGPGTRGRLYADYQDQSVAGLPSASNLFAAVDLSRSAARTSTFVFTTLSQSSAGPFSSFASRVVHTQTFGSQFSGEAVVDVSRTTSVLGTDDELFPRLTLRYFNSRYSAALVLDTRIDLDSGRFVFDDRYTLARLPELTAALAPFRLGRSFLIGQVEGGIGRFRETTIGVGPRTVEAGRADVLVTVSGPVSMGRWGTLGLRGFARGTWYTTGDARLFYGTRLDYSVPLTGTLEARLGYTGQSVTGGSPFVFDQITGTLSVADAQVFYRMPRLFVRASTSYDLQSRQFGNLVMQAVYLPRPAWSIGLAASYNVGLRRLDRIEANLDLRLSEQWQLQYVGFYDGAAGRLVHDRVSITRTFCDCVALSLTYLGAREEVWLEAWLTAIPWGRGKLGIGARGNLLFEQPVPFLPR